MSKKDLPDMFGDIVNTSG